MKRVQLDSGITRADLLAVEDSKSAGLLFTARKTPDELSKVSGGACVGTELHTGVVCVRCSAWQVAMQCLATTKRLRHQQMHMLDRQWINFALQDPIAAHVAIQSGQKLPYERIFRSAMTILVGPVLCCVTKLSCLSDGCCDSRVRSSC